VRGTQLGSLFYVDEPSCVGCTRCAEIAPKTFEMESEWGRARVAHQNGDEFEQIREAIKTCPSECIHQVTQGELGVLEAWRHEHLDKVQRAHATRRLVGTSAPPPWWQPLRDASGGEGSGWHPIISEIRKETKATIDFMGVPEDAAAGALNIAEEDALELKYKLEPTAQIKDRDDVVRMLRKHYMLVAGICLAFTLQGIEILQNDVYF
jgi:ferredoxin